MPRLRAVLAATCVLATGCPVSLGDPTAAQEPAASGDCAFFDGSYRFSYSSPSTLAASGCATPESEVLEFSAGQFKPPFTASCRFAATSAETVCDVALDYLCMLTDPSTGGLLGSTRVRGTLTEIEDNTRAEGEVDITLTDTNGSSCDGTFHVVAVRLK